MFGTFSWLGDAAGNLFIKDVGLRSVEFGLAPVISHSPGKASPGIWMHLDGCCVSHVALALKEGKVVEGCGKPLDVDNSFQLSGTHRNTSGASRMAIFVAL